MSRSAKRKSVPRKQRVFDIIQIGNTEDLPSRAFDWFIVIAILLNILVMFLSTFRSLRPFHTVLSVLELVTIGIFSIEYILRIWTADLLYPDKTPLRARLRFLRSFDGVVDLMTILPFFFLDGFVVFRMLRVVRIFHLFRLNAQYDSFQIIVNVLYEKRNQILSSVFIIVVLMFASSLCMYGAEHEAQPEAFKNAFSGVWWSMSTLLTVGYGDIYPVTAVGKFMAICIAFLGVGAVAIPTGIISAGFVAQYTEKEHAGSRFRDVSEVGEIFVDAEHELCGLPVSEVQTAYGLQVLLLLRGELTVLPRPELTVQAEDMLIVRSEKLMKKQQKKLRKSR
ncbi:MAG: ion transporter [Oscillospiraceae bacterium]|nr:ion transporter [Oscillospiraceae bacterium]